MSEREKIFGRIREALKAEAPPPDLHDHSIGSSRPHPTQRQWLPKVGESSKEQLALFAKNAAGLKSGFSTCSIPLMKCVRPSSACAMQKVGNEWPVIPADLTNAICPILNLPFLRTDKAYDVNELEACDVGISECDALIAQTGQCW